MPNAVYNRGRTPHPVSYLGASPSKKAVARIKENVGQLLVPGNTGTWEEARNRLNQILRGWSAYFNYGTSVRSHIGIGTWNQSFWTSAAIRRGDVPFRLRV